MSEKGNPREGNAMQAMWKEMEQHSRERAKAGRPRAQPIILGSSHLIWSTQSSSSVGSTQSSNSSANSLNHLCIQRIAQQPRQSTDMEPALVPSDFFSCGPAPAPSASSSHGPPDVSIDSLPRSLWVSQGADYSGPSPSSSPHYSVPSPSFMDTPPLLQTPDVFQEFRGEAASGRQVTNTLTSKAVADAVPGPTELEPDAASRAAPSASSAPEDAEVAATGLTRPAVRKAKVRPRPPKPKREQGKLLAEMYFKAELESDEQREIAEQVFLNATKDDPQLYDYAHQVLRSLSAEARDREALGEDPSLTKVHR